MAPESRLGLLFVCTGNICRSPMAEGLAKHWLEQDYPGTAGEVTVASAGVSALVGEGPTAEATAVMASRGIDIEAHRARDVERGMLEESSLVLTMEDRQTRHARSIAPAADVHNLLRAAEVAGNLRAGPGGLSGAGGPKERLGLLLESLGEVEREGLWLLEPGAYDVEDPYGRARDFYEWAACRLERPVCNVLDVMFGGREME
ncbi:MAG: hypothetical protein KKF41_12740 [Actinobacteria bacterium]|nr:hypothetical protein [Actinomycetota bacterium]MBU1944961.1 hypothetical protein [Actinomycetota bacterium]MBU2688443.1 hypothetical protein [Actinomycetota bacterium]